MENIKNRIWKVIVERLEVDLDTDSMNIEENFNLNKIEDYGIEVNSIAVLEIIIGLEDEFDISIDESEVGNIVEDLNNIVEIVGKSS